jgi:integrase
MGQAGQIFKSHGAWFVRFYSNEIVDGVPARRRITKRLAPICDAYRNKKDVQPLADEHTGNLNAGVPESGLTVGHFAESYFLPFIKAKRSPSTHKFYREVFENHLQARIGEVRLRDFTTGDAQRVLDEIDLSHKSLLRIKTGMSALFTYARQRNFIRTANPVQGSKAEGRRTDPEQYAYSLDEVMHMLEKLSDVAHVAVAIASFSGMRESEIRGLQWPDYTGDYLHVRRRVWRTHVGETKTPDSKNAIPVIAPLKKILDRYKKVAANGSDGWILQGEKKSFALNLDNLCRRDIRPVLGSRWHGWHAFRRGLATNLFNLGVPAETARIILRHARVETTRAHYIILESKGAGAAAMQKLEKAIGKWAAKGQQRKPRKSR